jgi:xanthine dehydrogenase accessory factor
MPTSIFQALVSACESPEPFALGIISGAKGSTPQKQGAKALFFPDGRIVGTLGGGCMEAEVRKRAIESLRDNQPAQFDLVLDHDFGWDDGLICGGKVNGLILPRPHRAVEIFRPLALREQPSAWGVRDDFTISEYRDGMPGPWLYRETVSPPERLWIAGAGHIARAVAPLAEQLDFAVTVFDDRPALADRKFFPGRTELCVDYWDKLLSREFPSRPTLGLIVTRGHQHDTLVLSRWAGKPFVFLGMIGSRRKRNIIFKHFLQEGIATQEQLDRVACPVGIPIGGVSVEEIALSIVAQLVQNRSERRISQEAASRIRSVSLIKARGA